MSCASKRRHAGRRRVRVRTVSDALPLPLPAPPAAPPQYPPPDLTPWLAGNCGLRGVHHFESGQPGPHTVVTALMHGNEPSGAYALNTLLKKGPQPRQGRLSLIFLNPDAYARYNPAHPTRARYVEEDMNRLWRPELIHSHHDSLEMRRLREVLPVIETADLLLDLHSMLWPGPPLFLHSGQERNHSMACHLANTLTPSPLVIRDDGHQDGSRLIDYERFSTQGGQARACLLETGQHWSQSAAQMALLAVRQFTGLTDATSTNTQDMKNALSKKTVVKTATVTDCVQAHTAAFAFVRPYDSAEIIPSAGTVIALDGPDEIRTPYDNCMLVMPNFRVRRGHTAVRLAQPAEQTL
ncbi:succinylglutamate desuccinylase/aspartoacylase family protein [Acetobacter suratthaniensis]|uniref:Succinylglutamate desuccinylase/aspartoacylase family protein n=1 Tax=Acetobacter suratthaniensis TaxID=1502841 RepID=A0ABS3LN57_9PROT|nr:succinylglutamate desuccinylase/aspartoacylase family protein [Acetobacter suratthaniensis]MBO1328777.1 succinylglutamate desuccinylase/aspartoacylase family protein [Acetobacter suratthaniensis]MCX2565836.1 succinylglutamate desuccinylase/aspartoacylase family protein [Acetobacter suratthaniensis]